MSLQLDDIDRAILQALQEDARHLSSDEIGERVGVAGSTVRKRIHRMEEAGLITAYRAEVDFEAAGYPLRLLLFCTASISDRDQMIPRILEQPGVVAVQELISGEQNILVTVVGQKQQDITQVAKSLVEMGLLVTDEILVRSVRSSPFRRFTQSQPRPGGQLGAGRA